MTDVTSTGHRILCVFDNTVCCRSVTDDATDVMTQSLAHGCCTIRAWRRGRRRDVIGRDDVSDEERHALVRREEELAEDAVKLVHLVV